MVARGSKEKMTYDFDLVAAGRYTNGMSKTFQIGDILKALVLIRQVIFRTPFT